MKTLNGYILVELITETISAGGIHLPEIQRDIVKGKVIECGDGKFFKETNKEQMDIRVDDIVYFNIAHAAETKIPKTFLVHYNSLYGRE